MRYVFALSFVLLMGFSAPTQAWSAFGHRLVALLAQDQLTPAARLQVEKLLAAEPNADLGTIAAWADEVRKTPTYAKTGPWHYVNFPDKRCRYVAKRDCSEGDCIVAQLERHRTRLQDRSLSLAERREALKYVVHLAGDIHQPLHAGYYHDRGGNRFQLRVDNQGTNLHSVWDYHLLKSGKKGMNAYRNSLTPRVAAFSPEPLTASDWAEASCRLLHEKAVYPKKQGELPSVYLDQYRPIAEEQIVQAAARLAAVLNQALQ